MKRSLLIEDHPDNRTIYRTLLEHAGYTVLECADRESALRAGGPRSVRRTGAVRRRFS